MKKILNTISARIPATISAAVSLVALFIFAFLEDPKVYTISLIGQLHFEVYMVLAVIMTFACFSNITRIRNKFDHQTKGSYIAMFVVSICGFLTAASTFAMPDFLPFYIFHWCVALTFCIGVPTLLFKIIFASIKRGHKYLKVPAYIFLALFMGDLIATITLFATLGIMGGKNGYIEIIVLAITLSMYLFFSNVNVKELETTKAK